MQTFLVSLQLVTKQLSNNKQCCKQYCIKTVNSFPRRHQTMVVGFGQHDVLVQRVITRYQRSTYLNGKQNYVRLLLLCTPMGMCKTVFLIPTRTVSMLFIALSLPLNKNLPIKTINITINPLNISALLIVSSCKSFTY